MSNYIVITYNSKDTNCTKPLHIKNFHYCSKEEVMEYVLKLKDQKDVNYEIYKEVYLEVVEEIS